MRILERLGPELFHNLDSPALKLEKIAEKNSTRGRFITTRVLFFHTPP